ncbi:MAG: NAD(P)/FAD-dependent oxidoreductase [Actinomycetota bacterium]
MTEIKKDLLIIGAGPAGLGAALYAKRADIDFAIVEKQMPGGQIVNTEFIENYLGFSRVSGFGLIENFVKHCQNLEVEVSQYCTVETVEQAEGGDGNLFRCSIADSDDSYVVRSIILASGARPKMLGVEGEKGLIGRGISFCATCDGALYRDKEVAVIGGGDTAVEEALFLAKFAKTVYIIHRRDELRAVKILQERAFENKRIKFMWGAIVEKFMGREKLQKIVVKNVKNGRTSKMDIQGVFEYVGFEANSGLVKDLVDLDPDGFVITDKYMKTSREGIYAAGDVRSTALRQVITAVSDGAVASTSMDKHLRGLM